MTEEEKSGEKTYSQETYIMMNVYVEIHNENYQVKIYKV